MKKLTATLLILIFVLTITLNPEDKLSASADSKYISVQSFSKLLAEKLSLTTNEIDTEDECIKALMEKSIIQDGDFKNVSSNITRTDAAVLINRADELLHGDKIDKTLLNFVLKKRISDIKKISESKREAVGKCIAKGIIKGYNNGYYIQNRKFDGSKSLTKSDATAYINLIVNTKKRAKLSPDGMLIRTTKLPKNVKNYPYILACYPNKFYEKKFEFMLADNWKKTNSEYYAYPIEMRYETFRNSYNEWPLSKEMDKHLYDWSALAEKYLNYVFNINYKTVDNKWIKGIASLYTHTDTNMADFIKKYYIKKVKSNKVVVESTVIAVEPSIFYEDTDYCIRAYVRYRITAKNINVNQNKLIYSQYPSLKNLKNGKWREGIFDIRFNTNDASNGDGSDFAIDDLTRFVD